jgi:hypothetical protein
MMIFLPVLFFPSSILVESRVNRLPWMAERVFHPLLNKEAGVVEFALEPCSRTGVTAPIIT